MYYIHIIYIRDTLSITYPSQLYISIDYDVSCHRKVICYRQIFHRSVSWIWDMWEIEKRFLYRLELIVSSILRNLHPRRKPECYCFPCGSLKEIQKSVLLFWNRVDVAITLSTLAFQKPTISSSQFIFCQFISKKELPCICDLDISNGRSLNENLE